MHTKSFRVGAAVLVGLFLGFSSAILVTSSQDAKAKSQLEEKAIRALIAQLGDNDFDKREAAEKRLLEIGEPALGLLKSAAKENADAETRHRVQQLLVAINRSFFSQVRQFGEAPQAPNPWANRVAVTADGRMAIASFSGAIRWWNIDSGKEGIALEGPKSNYTWALALSPDEKQLIAGSSDRIVRIIDLQTGKQLQQFVGHGGNLWGVAILRGGKQALTAALDQSIRVWDVETGKQVRVFENVRDHVRCFAIAPDGDVLAAGHFQAEDSPATVRLWQISTGKELRSMTGHSKAISQVAFSRDGKMLMSSGFDGVIRIWETSTGKELKALRGHKARVESCGFTPDGKRVVSCGDQDDQTVRLWDVETGTQILESAEVKGGLTSLAVLPDGRGCLTSGKDGIVRLWEWKR